MPYYEYKCKECCNVSSLIKVEFNPKPYPKCTLCDGETEILVSISSYNIKGHPKFKPLKESKPKSYVPDPIRRSKK